jgi:hypothetical protein
MPQATTVQNPTLEQWASYQSAFDYFNIVLFNGELPRCILNFSRHAKAYGFFAPVRWSKGETITHEISLNPDTFSRPLMATMATLVHEMCHLWDWEQGNTSSRGYHGKSWADQMEAIGLMPTDTGLPGGKRTGFKVTHSIESDGLFEQAFKRMPTDYLIPWQSATIARLPTKPGEGEAGKASKAGTQSARTRNKVKYSCPGCSLNVWGRSGLRLMCSECDRLLAEQG